MIVYEGEDMIRIILLLLIAILPVYLIGLYIYNKDTEKESKRLLFKLFCFGIVACIPAVILEFVIGSFFDVNEGSNLFLMFFYIFCSIAFVEEICKWLFVYKISYMHYEFDQIYDAIVYCVFLSLGFAAFENIFYILDGGFKIGLLRAVCSVPGHACFAIAMGNYLGFAKLAYFNKDKKVERKNLILSIVVPIILHGLYDFCLVTDNLLFLMLFLGILVFIYIYGIKTVKKMSKVTEKFVSSSVNLDDSLKCPICGTDVVGRFCIHCGYDLSRDNC